MECFPVFIRTSAKSRNLRGTGQGHFKKVCLYQKQKGPNICWNPCLFNPFFFKFESGFEKRAPQQMLGGPSYFVRVLTIILAWYGWAMAPATFGYDGPGTS